MLLDPTDKEEAMCYRPSGSKTKGKNHGIMMQANLPQHNQIAELYFVGDIDMSCMKPAVESMNAVSDDICLVLQQCLVKSVIKCLKEKKQEEDSTDCAE